jgi:bifunctional enzyme CysN/CysC
MSIRTKRAVAPAIKSTSATPRPDLVGIVRVLTCGSVDDGKSTLIGRLLWDASDLFEDQREALRRSTRRVLDGTHLDYSLLVDGLLAEREQGITIDIAWRYFDTADKRFVIIDSPGHEQYTRNMASGASHADVAVMLIDARHGIKPQTKRHAAILDLFGVRRVVLAINKMDLVDWSEQTFRAIEAEFKQLTWRFRFEEATALPVAAVTGDNVARSSGQMSWYKGPTLLDVLSRADGARARSDASFRMPVQTVLRDGQDFRGFAGTITSGQVKAGDWIVDAISGRSAKVVRIATFDGDRRAALAGQAVALVLDRDIDVSRGTVLSGPGSVPVAARSVEAKLVWLSEAPFDPKAQLLLRTATDLVPVSALVIRDLLDLETLARKPSITCSANDIAVVSIALARATAADAFADHPATGAFVLVDAVSGSTVAGGTISGATTHTATLSPAGSVKPFRLTRAILESGICADLVGVGDSEKRFAERAAAAVALLRSAGIAVADDTGTDSHPS